MSYPHALQRFMNNLAIAFQNWHSYAVPPTCGVPDARDFFEASQAADPPSCKGFDRSYASRSLLAPDRTARRCAPNGVAARHGAGHELGRILVSFIRRLLHAVHDA